MGMMSYREANQVNWFGTRPGHNGTQVLESFTTNVVGATPFYTVPAGETLYLTHAMLCNNIDASCGIGLDVYDSVPARVARLLLGISIIGQQSLFTNASYWPPIEIPENYILYIWQTVNVWALTTVHGWVE